MASLRRASAALGNERLLIQGAGGNTSLKFGNDMWIKASGKWLRDAETEEIFVHVNLAEGRLSNTRDEKPADLKPSIETSMHACLNAAVVIHVHSIASLVLSVRSDGQSLMEEKLAGLDWDWIRYARPGEPLTDAIIEQGGQNRRILILSNHGLVVTGADTTEAIQLLEEVELCLATDPRPTPKSDLSQLKRLAQGSIYKACQDEQLNALATDSTQLRIVREGSMYPDHVVFLGPKATVFEQHDSEFGDWLGNASHYPLGLPKVILIPNSGILLHQDTSEADIEMVYCLSMLAARLPDNAPINYLSTADEAALLNWDAEKYRRDVN